MKDWIILVSEWIGEAEKALFHIKLILGLGIVFTTTVACILSCHINKLTRRIEQIENRKF